MIRALHGCENRTSGHTHHHGLLIVLLAADEMGYFRTDIHCEFPAVAYDPLLHFVMSTAHSEVASDSDGEWFQRIFHGGWKRNFITPHKIKNPATNDETKEVIVAKGNKRFAEIFEMQRVIRLTSATGLEKSKETN